MAGSRPIDSVSIVLDTLTEGVALNELVFNAAGEVVDYRVLEVNPAFYRQADYHHGVTVVGGLATELYGMSTAVIQQFYQAHRDVQQTVTVEYTSPLSQKVMEVSTSPFVDQRFLTTFHDISAQKLAEKKLLSYQFMLERTEETSGVGSWEWHVRTDTVVWSREVYRIFERDPSLGTPRFARQGHLFHVDDYAKLKRAAVRVLTTGEVEILDVRCLTENGTEKLCHVTCHREPSSTRWDRVLYGTLQDISESRKTQNWVRELESRMQQSSKMESLGLLASGIAHDLNNVLGAIQSIASVHLAEGTPSKTPEESFRTIVQAVSRGSDRISSLLGFARKSESTLAALSLNDIVSEQLTLLEASVVPALTVVRRLEERLPLVWGDASALGMVLMNLCVNAVHAMEETGRERILTVGTSHRPGIVELWVSDTGTGMSKEIRDKVFQTFFTTKEAGKGTGLGLAMVASVVKAHNGRILVESDPDEGGTTFRLQFDPVQNAKSAPGRRILLADDDPLIRESVGELLETMGHQVVTVDSGEQALEKLDRDGPFHAVFLDLNMPGWGGAVTLGHLRQRASDLWVVLISGALPGVPEASRPHDPRVLQLAKPFTLESLVLTMDRLNGRGGERPSSPDGGTPPAGDPTAP